MKKTIALAAVAIGLLYPSMASADGIDLVTYFSRTPFESIKLAIPAAALLMLANYGLNFLVIGLPAFRLGSLQFSRVSISLLWLTLFGQLADRIGAIIAGLFADSVLSLLGLHGEGAWIVPLLAMNFLFSGVAVGMLAFIFTGQKWKLQRRYSLWISIAAGVLTNPAWAMGLWFLS